MRTWLRLLSVLVMLGLVACANTGRDTSTAQVVAYQTPNAEAGMLRGEVFHWKTVGGDPCSVRAGCTLEFALKHSGWSVDAQRLLINAVRTKKPQAITLSSGWRGWMTWGSSAAKFHPNTVAEWPQGQREPADLWFVDVGGVRYNLFRVHRCKNWGGNTSVPSSSTMTSGGTPTVSCS